MTEEKRRGGAKPSREGIKKAAGEIRTRVGHLGKVVRNHYATAA